MKKSLKEISVFPSENGANLNGVKREMRSMDDAYRIITEDAHTKNWVDEARLLLLEGDEEGYRAKKTQKSDVFLFQSNYNGKRNQDNVTELTGWVCIDIDHIEDAPSLRDKLFADKTLNPTLVFVSPSMKGVKCVVRHKGVEGAKDEAKKLRDAYKQVYRNIAAYLYMTYGYETDMQCEKAEHCCFASHDKDCRYNPECPYTEVPKMMSDAVETLFSKMENKPKPKYNGTTEYDKQAHWEIVRKKVAGLHKDENGNYIYTPKRVEVGHRHNGTEKFNIDGREGYEIMLPLNSCACALYGGDLQRADMFLQENFPEYGKAGWNKVSTQHAETPPAISVLEWLLKELEFERDEAETYTTIIDFPASTHDKECVAHNWNELDARYKLPMLVRRWFEDDKIRPQRCDLRLYSALTLMSGFAPNQRIMYNDGAMYGLNQQLLVIGAQGSGKSDMKIPYKLLVGAHLDGFMDLLTDMERNRFRKERAMAKAAGKKNNNTTVVFPEDDEPEEAEETQDTGNGGSSGNQTPTAVLPPLYFTNNIGKPTYASLLCIIPANNAKCVLMTTEASIWHDADEDGRINIGDLIKNVYDNDTLSNETAENIENQKPVKVHNPNVSVLCSGTHAEAKKLFKSVEGGELRRIMPFLYDKEEWVCAKSRATIEDNSDIELMFLQWYFYCFFTKRRWVYVLSEADDKKFGEMYNDFYYKTVDAFGGITDIARAREAVVGCSQVYTLRLAALLQSLDEFETYIAPKLPKTTPEEYLDINGIAVWDDEQRSVVFKTALDYIDTARANITNPNRLPSEELPLEWRWVELAHQLMQHRLMDALTWLGSREEGAMVRGVSDTGVGLVRNIVFDKLPKRFTTKEYKDAWAKVNGKEAHDGKISREIKQLTVLKYIKKLKHGVYEKCLK